MFYLTIDLGTTSVKIALINENGLIVALSNNSYSLTAKAEHVVECPVELYWEKTKIGITEVLSRTNIPSETILSICICSQGETLICLDKNGQPLLPAIVWLDNRSHLEAIELDDQVGLGDTGLISMEPTWTATKILWIKRNKPEIFRNIHKFLLPEDYLIYRFTGMFIGEYSLYPTTALLDVKNKTWYSKMLDYLGISKDLLVSLTDSGTIIGMIDHTIANELGLSRNIKIITGAMDQTAGMIGAGNISPEIISETTGGALVVCATLNEYQKKERFNTAIQNHALTDKFLSTGWLPVGGLSYTWLQDLFFNSPIFPQPIDKNRSDLFKKMNETASRIPIGSDGLMFFPFMAGTGTLSLQAKIKGSFIGVDLHHSQAHFYRAVMESIAFELRELLVRLTSKEFQCKQIRSMGGGSKSTLWNQIKCDVCGIPIVTLASNETASLGIAILSSCALKHSSSIEEAVETMVHINKVYEVNEKNHAAYNERFEQFIKLQSILYL